MSHNHGPLVAAIDQGTSSSRFLVFSAKTGELVTFDQKELKRITPKEGWVEMDANEILEETLVCVDKTVENLQKLGLDPADIKAIGITNQRETTIAWDKYTGEPLYNAIVWLDLRTSAIVERILGDPSLKTQIEKVQRLSGLPISTYFSALKMKWLLENVSSVKTALEEGRLMVGTVDTFLIWHLTGGKSGGLYMTDCTNASRTMLMNLETLQWDSFLCDFFKIPINILPEIRSSSEVYGQMTRTSLKGLPISGCLGDQQAALVGQLCFKPGQAKCTFGTGCFLLFNTGEKIIHSKSGLLTTVGYKMGPNKKAIYALEGSVAVAGLAVRWLRDSLALFKDFEEMDNLASSVKDTANVYFVPAFSGLFCPYWNSTARGVICGLTEAANKAHIVRATLEATAFQIKDILVAIGLDGDVPQKSLFTDGGMTKNDLLMALTADILGIEVLRPSMSETTALGAAMAAGNAINVWDISSDDRSTHTYDTFLPNITETEREERYWRWKEAIKRSYAWEVSKDELKSVTDKRQWLFPVFCITSFCIFIFATHRNLPS